jgi:hypothetical protein
MNTLDKLAAWWRSPVQTDPLIEGPYADQYQDPAARTYIQTQYQQRWRSEPTPASKPELFDPLTPPQGWRYDPYYECWIEETN